MSMDVLMYKAISEGSLAKVKNLLKKGCSPDTILTASSRLTTLIHATIKRRLSIVNLLIQCRVSLNTRDNRGMTALMYACVYDLDDILSSLLSAGADSTQEDDGGKTALLHAAQEGSIKCLKELVQCDGQGVNTVDSEGKSPVMLADNIECLRFLLNNGADFDRPDKRGDCPLSMAIHLCKLEHAEILLENGAEVNVKNQDGKTPLTKAFEQISKEVMLQLVVCLLNKGAVPRLSPYDEDYLHEMISRGQLTIVRQMIVNGCAPRIRLCKENVFNFDIAEEISPLAVALLSKQLGVAKYLIANSFLTPFDIHKLPNHREIHSYLNRNNFAHCSSLLRDISSTPFPLITTSLVSVSSLFYDCDSKEGKEFISSQLPRSQCRKLLFRTETVSICLHEWETIPLMIESDVSDQFLHTRPLSVYWPIGHRLEQCQSVSCTGSKGYRISKIGSL